MLSFEYLNLDIKLSGYFPFQVDVFSFGIVMWEPLTGEEPYASMHYGAIIGLSSFIVIMTMVIAVPCSFILS